MKIKTQKLFKASFYILLFLSLFIKSIELNLLAGFLIFFFISSFTSNKYSTTLINVITPLLLILLISFASGLFYDAKLYDVIKDFSFFLKPILFIVLGFLLISRITDKNFIFRALIYTAVISATIHLVELLIFTINHPFSVNRIRGDLGRDNFIELFALVLLFVKSTRVFYSEAILKRINIFKFILLVSFVFYFSRTMVISFFIVIIALNGYAKISSRGLIYITIFNLLTIALFTSLQFADLKRESKGVEGFFYKIKMAPSEIFSPDIDINTKNHRSLWDHWRAYEALKAIEGISDTKYKLGWLFGKGLGAQVDLGFEAPLDGKKFQYIPIIHNGYVYVIFKSGIIGLIIYLVFLLITYMQSYKQGNYHVSVINNFISGIALFFMLTSLIITGIYNSSDIIVFILGGLFALQFYYSNQHQTNEDRHIRN